MCVCLLDTGSAQACWGWFLETALRTLCDLPQTHSLKSPVVGDSCLGAKLFVRLCSAVEFYLPLYMSTVDCPVHETFVLACKKFQIVLMDVYLGEAQAMRMFTKLIRYVCMFSFTIGVCRYVLVLALH